MTLTEQLASRAEEHDRTGSFPYEGVAAVHEAGLLNATIGTRFGGAGAGLARTVDILRQVGKGDPSVALVTAMTLFTHAAQDRAGGWPAGVYDEVLAESVQRPVLLNGLRVEPELGTPARGGPPRTTARRDGDHWLLSGHKIFSTGAEALRWMVVWARTDEDPVRVGGFLVRGDSPGVTVLPTWDHLGLRASRSDDVLFTDVAVPYDATIGLVEHGSAPDRRDEITAWNSLGLTALYLGVAEAAQEWLVGFLNDRVPTNLGAPLATLPRFQAAVGEIEVALLGAITLVRGLAERVDDGDADAVVQSAGAKTLGTRAAITAVEQAVSLAGNHGLSRSQPLERHYRDVLCSRVHTPQDDVIISAAGRSALSRKGG
jgi:alkylation response protein AidB-like acyl-CoA dehydrogenase